MTLQDGQPRLATVVGAAFGLVGLAFWAGRPGPLLLPTPYTGTAVAFSPDGTRVALGQEILMQNRAEGWAYMSGMLLLRSSSASSEEKRIPFLKQATRSEDGKDALGAVGWIEFSPDGRLLLAANYHCQSVAVLEVATGRWLFARNGELGESHLYRVVGFGSDGTRAVFLQIKRPSPGAARSDLWDEIPYEAKLITCEAATGKRLAAVRLDLHAGEWPIRAVLTPDNSRVLCLTKAGSDGRVMVNRDKLLLLDARTGLRLRQTALGGEVTELACSPDGRTLATLTHDGAVSLWTEDLTPLGKAAGRTTGPYKSRSWPGGRWLAFSPSGHLLAGVSRDGVALWDVQRRRMARYLPARGKWAWTRDLAFSPDGKRLAVADGGRSALLWTVAAP